MSFFHFSLPSATSPEHILSEFKPTCVVGLVGHSRSDPSSMAAIINSSLPGAQFVLTKSTSEIQVKYTNYVSRILSGNLKFYNSLVVRPDLQALCLALSQ